MKNNFSFVSFYRFLTSEQNFDFGFLELEIAKFQYRCFLIQWFQSGQTILGNNEKKRPQHSIS